MYFEIVKSLHLVTLCNINNSYHYLFDNQNLETKAFIPVTDVGIGFQYGDQKIYIKENEVESYDIKEDRIIINGKEMVMMFIKTS